MGRNSLELIRETFRLEGEDVVRIRTGRQVKETPSKARGYCQVGIMVGGRPRIIPLHRVKFALKHGYLPPTVDHADRDRTNNLLSNLRAAGRAEQSRNRGAWRSLPRGVYRNRGAKGERYYAAVKHEGQQKYLGSFATVGAASAVVEAVLRNLHGEFYHAQPAAAPG